MSLNFRAKMSVSAIFKHSVSFKVCKKVSQTRKGFLLHFKSFCMDFKGVKGEERTKKREPKRNLKSAARERVRPRQSRKRHQSLSCNSVTSNPYAFLFLLRSFVPLLGWLLQLQNCRCIYFLSVLLASNALGVDTLLYLVNASLTA